MAKPLKDRIGTFEIALEKRTERVAKWGKSLEDAEAAIAKTTEHADDVKKYLDEADAHAQEMVD